MKTILNLIRAIRDGLVTKRDLAASEKRIIDAIRVGQPEEIQKMIDDLHLSADTLGAAVESQSSPETKQTKERQT